MSRPPLGASPLTDHRDERDDDPARKRRSIGEQLIEDRLVDPQQGRGLERRDRRRARLGNEGGQLTDGRAGSEDGDVAVAVVHAEAAAHDGEQVVLHSSLDDDAGARGDVDLARVPGDSREGAARDIGEQVDALERDDALDGGHRHAVTIGDRRRPPARRPAGAGARLGRRALPGS